MKLRLRTLALATTLLASQTTSSSAATVLWDNTANLITGYAGVSNTQWIAQEFKTTAGLYVIESLTLGVSTGNATDGSLIVDIYNNAGTGGSPGAFVTSLATIAVTSLSGSSHTVSNLNATLAPGTTYYLVARGSNISDSFGGMGSYPGFMQWRTSNASTGTGPGFESASLNYSSIDAGGSWAWPSSTEKPRMSITAGSASAIPEPSGMLSLAALVVSAAGIRRRASSAA